MPRDLQDNLVSLSEARAARRRRGFVQFGQAVSEHLAVIAMAQPQPPELLALLPTSELKRQLREARKDLHFDRGYREGAKRWREVLDFHPTTAPEIQTLMGVADMTLNAARERCREHVHVIRAIRAALIIQQCKPEPA